MKRWCPMGKKNEERRRTTRIFYYNTINIYKNKNIFKGKIVDLSLKGFLVKFENEFDLRIDNEVKFSFNLPFSSENLKVSGFARVVRLMKGQAGFYITSLTQDSLLSLRKIISWNYGNADQIDQELSEFKF